MDQRISKLLFLLCVWCLLHAGELMVGVTAQTTVTAAILTPEADRKVGKMVHMRCIATNLEPNHTVEWKIGGTTLRWGNRTISGTDHRFMFETRQTGNREITQEFTITDLQQMNNDEYFCNVHERLTGGGNQILATASVMLRVYSPSESFPICSPDGAIAVDSGTEINMRCSSDTVNHAAMVEVSSIPTVSNSDTWTTSSISGIVSRSLNLTVTVADDKLAFECVIPSVTYVGMSHSCRIGPITVTATTESLRTGPTTESSQSETEPATRFTADPTQPVSNAAIIAGASAGGVAALLIILILILICRRRGLCNNKPANPKSKTDISSDPTSTKFETGQPHVYRNEGVEIYDKPSDPGNPHEPTRSNIDTSPARELDASYFSISPVTPTTKYNTAPVYAKPHKATNPTGIETEAKTSNPDQFFNNATEQRYSNPVFDSTSPDNTTGPFEEGSSTTLKPIAKVSPMTKVPKKPQPYKPKAQRASDPRDGAPNQQDTRMPLRLKSTPSPSPAGPAAVTQDAPLQDGDGVKTDAPAPHNGETYYAQVSVPNIKSGTERNQPSSPDNLVYADLDFQPDASEDGGQSLSSTEPHAVYARVMENGPN